MVSNPTWIKARKSYIERMNEQLDINNLGYGFSKCKVIYANAFSLETVLNDVTGIEPDRIEQILSSLENAVNELREWQKLKLEDWNRRNATT